jgi:hypothetical protein
VTDPKVLEPTVDDIEPWTTLELAQRMISPGDWDAVKVVRVARALVERETPVKALDGSSNAFPSRWICDGCDSLLVHKLQIYCQHCGARLEWA